MIGSIILLAVLILLNAVFASAEIAVISMNEAKLKKLTEEGNKKAVKLSRLTQQPARFLATIQVAITLAGFLSSAFAADYFAEPLVKALTDAGVPVPVNVLNSLSVVVITVILSYFSLIFGELVPKRIAMKKSEELALGISGLVSFISTLFAPIVWFLSFSTNTVLRLIGIDPNEADDQVSEEEIRLMVDAGSENGAIDREEQEFIQNVFEFDDLTAGEIGTHRTDVLFLWMEDSMDEWDATIHSSRHTLYPVCEGSADHIVGVFNAKDYFRLKDKSRTNVITHAIHPAYFVPETLKADVLFRNMRATHNSMAIVLDEYGGIAGIITLHDLVEELVGSLMSSGETPGETDPYIESLGEDSYSIHGNVSLRDLEDATGVTLEEDCDTFTGLAFNLLGNVPEDGPQDILLEHPKMSIHISLVEDHQVEEATVKIKPAPAAEE